MAKIERAWSLLPADLLRVIFKKFTSGSVGDYLRFAAVCHPWRSAASPDGRPRCFPSQLPWLLLPYQLEGDGNHSKTTYEFYDLSESKTQKLFLPEMEGKGVCGSSHGWFVLVKGQELSLFNPLTRGTISLPPLTAPPDNLGIHPLYSPDEVFLGFWDPSQVSFKPDSHCQVIKAMVTSNPLLDPDCMVIVLFKTIWDLACCRIGDQKWTVIEFAEDVLPLGYDLVDFTYSNGIVYVISIFGSLRIYNLKNGSRMVVNLELGLWDMHLLAGEREELLLLYCGETSDERETPYMVYKLCTVNGGMGWIEEKDIGANMICLAPDSHAISLPTKFGANRMYCDWIDSERSEKGDDWRDHRIALARIEDRKYSEMTRNLWVTPSTCPNSIWQKSLWLTPSLF